MIIINSKDKNNNNNKTRQPENPPITTKTMKFTSFTSIPKTKMMIVTGNWSDIMGGH